VLTRRSHPTRRPARRGVALAKVLMCLFVLFAVVALNLDGGRMMDERGRAQAAADAAALAAGAELYSAWWKNHGTDPGGTARAAAEEVAAANGYPAGAVTVNIPPTSGTYAGKAGHVEVRIATTLDASFGRAFTGSGLDVGARSVARGEPLNIGIILLRPNGAAAFNNSALVFGLVNKPLIVNSSDSQALRSTGLTLTALGRVDVTGGKQISSLLVLSGKVRTGVRPTLDPLARLPVPTSSTVRSATPLTVNTIIPTILQPGVYKGGIRLTGPSVVVMNPGVYIMEGGGFRVDGLATVAGLGVMVYNSTSATYPPGPIRVEGAGKAVLRPPSPVRTRASTSSSTGR